MYGNNVQCMYMTFSLPSCVLNWRIASMNGRPSMSPVVPPISVITISASVASPLRNILDLISFVICGMTRSEERRVGKECRSRWWEDHYRENVGACIQKWRKDDDTVHDGYMNEDDGQHTV